MAQLVSKIARVVLIARDNEKERGKWFFRCKMSDGGAEAIVSLPLVAWTDDYVVLNLNATADEVLEFVIDAKHIVWAMADYNCVALGPYIGPMYNETL